MSVIDTLITDRSYSDVEALTTLQEAIVKGTATPQQISEWNSASHKGAYNYTDLNRVNEALAYLRDREVAVLIFPYPLKTNWAYSDEFGAVAQSQYLANINIVRNIVGMPIDAPRTPTKISNIHHANAIEKILQLADEALSNIVNGSAYLGDTYLNGGI